MTMKRSAVTISLREAYDEFMMSRAEGETLGADIARALRAGEVVVLDFDGVRAVVSAFLNPAIGDLYENFDPDDIDARVTAINLSPSQRETFEAVKRNGRRFYNDPEFQKNVIATRDALFD